MPRCCTPVPDEFKPSYASALVGDLPFKISALERGPLIPCITAWCERCARPHLLTTALPLFPCPSAHHAHMAVLVENLQKRRQ